MNETLSDRIDIVEQCEKDKQVKEQKRQEKIIKKTDKLVEKQFNKALKILGHRLTVNRNHYNMYSFYFRIPGDNHLHWYINKHEIVEDCFMEFNNL